MASRKLPICPPWGGDDSAEHDSPDLRQRAEDAKREACNEVRRRFPNRGDIAGWHRHIFAKVAPLPEYAGNYRQDDPKRPCLAKDVGVAGAPGAPYQLVLQVMTELVEFFRKELAVLDVAWESRLDADNVSTLALVVGNVIGGFVHIHPFVNGTGRTSRLLWSVLLHRYGVPEQVSVVDRPGLPYGDVMQAAMRGDYSPAIAYVLLFIASATEPAHPPSPKPN